MVLALKLGRQRSFGVGLLLVIATIGIYGIYWRYRAHAEVYRQFELARESRDDGVVWWVMARVLPVLYYPYAYHFVSNTHYLLTRMGQPKPFTPAKFLAFIIPASVSLFVLGVIGLLVIDASLGIDFDDNLYVADEGLLAVGIVLLLVGLLTYAVLQPLGHYFVQRDLNRIWDLYDMRAGQIRQAAVAAPATPSLPAAPRPGIGVPPKLPPRPAPVRAPPPK